MKKSLRILLIIGGSILGLLVILIVYLSLFAQSTVHFTKPIAEEVPMAVPGWTSRELPLAATESMQEAVNRVLQFDQYVYRLYERDDMQVSVYVAYWRPGKVTTTDAGTHNPDSCWVNAGWTRLERKHGLELSVNGQSLLPFEYGVYEMKDTRLPVIFWHIVGGEINRYEEQKEGWRDGLVGRIERLPLVLGDLKKYGLNQRREQMFIRITANKSFGELFKNKDFLNLLEALKPLGIFQGQGWSAEEESRPLPGTKDGSATLE